MKRTIPFNAFGADQTIYFDISRLVQFERLMGKSIMSILASGDVGLNFIVNGLVIGLKHHYNNASPQFIENKLDDFFSNGGTIDEVTIPIIQAITASGIFGKEAENEEKNEMNPA